MSRFVLLGVSIGFCGGGWWGLRVGLFEGGFGFVFGDGDYGVSVLLLFWFVGVYEVVGRNVMVVGV